MPIGWYVKEPPTSGVLDVIKGKATANFLGVVPTMGALTLNVPKLAMAMTGTHPYTGAIAAQAKSAVASLVGSQTIPGNIALAVRPVTASIGGSTYNAGQISASAQKANAALVGTSMNLAQLVATAKQATASLVGGQTIPGVLAASVKPATALLADATSVGSVTASLARATAGLAGFQEQRGDIVALMKPITAVINGIEHPRGSIASSVLPATAALNGGQTIAATSFAAALKIAQAAFASEQSQTGTISPVLKTVTCQMSAAPPAITINAVGAGNRSTTAGFTVTTTYTIVIPSDGLTGKRLVAFVGGGQDSWVDTYGARSVTSSVGNGTTGTFTGVVFVPFGNSSGYKQAWVAMFELLDPLPGTHTITASQAYSQNIFHIMSDAICLAGVGSRGTPVTEADVAGTATAANVVLANSAGDMMLIGHCGDTGPATLSGAWPTSAPAQWYSAGSSIGGQGDYMRLGYVPGDGTSKTFAATAITHGSIGVNYIKA